VSSKLQIKGIREGLLVTLGDGEWPDMRSLLLETIDQQVDFFRGGKLYIDVGSQILHAAELGRLRDELSERGLSLWGVLSFSPTTEQTAQILGMATRLSKPSVSPSYRAEASSKTHAQDGEDAVLLRRTLRSGFRIQHEGHIIIVGDVNPGAEISAGGSIIVWGKLRGNVHAGMNGDELALVCALDLNPTQIRIADYAGVVHQRRGKSQPEMAHLKDSHVVIEPWQVGKKG
jgi:septum site-determining protein MinC